MAAICWGKGYVAKRVKKRAPRLDSCFGVLGLPQCFVPSGSFIFITEEGSMFIVVVDVLLLLQLCYVILIS